MNETKTNQRWMETFTFELRLQDVSGKDTGDAVAHVESYCVDSNESFHSAFGDPAEYAKSLELDKDKWNYRRAIRAALPSLVGLVAFLVFLRALDGAFHGEPFRINPGQIGFLAVLIAAAIMAIANLSTLLKNKWVMITFVLIGPAAGVGIAVSGSTSASGSALALPALPTTIAAACTLLGTALWGHFRDRNKADPIVKPLERSNSSGSGAEPSGGAMPSGLGNWLLVIAAPVFAAVQYFIASQ